MHTLKRLAFTACLLAFSGWACAAPIPLAHGAWKVRMSMPGVPPQVATMLNQDIPEVCLRPGAVQPPHMPRPAVDRCRVLQESGTVSHWQGTEFCPASGQQPAIRIAMTLAIGPHHKSYVQTSHVLQGPGAGMPPSVMRGTWVGPKCPASPSKPMPAMPMPAPH